MKHKNGGFTLVEIIVSLALICILAIGIIPVFAAQFKITLDTKKITMDTFGAQGEVERTIFDLKTALSVNDTTKAEAIPGVTPRDYTLFGETVTMYRLERDFPDNMNKSFVVFLSQKLAAMEVKTMLVASGVKIEVSGESVHEVADLKKTPKPSLNGIYDRISDPNLYTYLFKWYVSKSGDPDPDFPEDYEQITFAGAVPDSITDLSKLINKYIIFSVTPVDIHGIRGNEQMSSNRVYVLGEEWRAGKFAWVDKNQDAIFTDIDDVKVSKAITGWPLLKNPFDTQNKFLNPGSSVYLDPSNGSLYVPMWIDRAAENPVVPISVNGGDALNWVVDKDIHLATDITAGNGLNKDIEMKTRDGNIVLYQYVQMNTTTEKVVYLSNGKPSMINRGAVLSAPYGNIELAAEGRGELILNNYSGLNAGKDISIIRYGDVSLYQAAISAGGAISIDLTKGNTFAGERNLLITNSSITLNGTATENREISIRSKNNLSITNSVIQGAVGSGPSGISNKVNLTTSTGEAIDIAKTTFSNIGVTLNNNTKFVSGGWDANTVITVDEGKKLSVSSASGQVNNQGALVLGNTSSISFSGGMSDLMNPLAIYLEKPVGRMDQVIISTNYGRNVCYAGSSSEAMTVDGVYRPLGSGTTNLNYSLTKVSGFDDLDLTLRFDGNGKITIDADRQASETGTVSSRYRLSIVDKYAENVEGYAFIKVRASEGQSPSVNMEGMTIPECTVTFNTNGGEVDANPISMKVNEGEALGRLPAAPQKTGYNFVGWFTSSDSTGGKEFNVSSIVSDNITVYARYSWIPVYWVQFNSNTGGNPVVDAVPNIIYVQPNKTIGALMPIPPQRANNWFKWWSTLPSGGTVVNADTTVTNNMIVYAQWSSKMPYANIPFGAYIKIKNTANSDIKFQKISDTELLAVTPVSNNSGNYSMNWSNADTRAKNYGDGFKALATNWVKSSRLASSGLLDDLDNTKNFRDNILKLTYSSNLRVWWSESKDDWNAYRISTSGELGSDAKSNTYYCRPCLVIDPADLYVKSGTGSSGTPYELVKEQGNKLIK